MLKCANIEFEMDAMSTGTLGLGSMFIQENASDQRSRLDIDISVHSVSDKGPPAGTGFPCTS